MSFNSFKLKGPDMNYSLPTRCKCSDDSGSCDWCLEYDAITMEVAGLMRTEAWDAGCVVTARKVDKLKAELVHLRMRDSLVGVV